MSRVGEIGVCLHCHLVHPAPPGDTGYSMQCCALMRIAWLLSQLATTYQLHVQVLLAGKDESRERERTRDQMFSSALGGLQAAADRIGLAPLSPPARGPDAPPADPRWPASQRTRYRLLPSCGAGRHGARCERNVVMSDEGLADALIEWRCTCCCHGDPAVPAKMLFHYYYSVDTRAGCDHGAEPQS